MWDLSNPAVLPSAVRPADNAVHCCWAKTGDWIAVAYVTHFYDNNITHHASRLLRTQLTALLHVLHLGVRLYKPLNILSGGWPHPEHNI